MSEEGGVRPGRDPERPGTRRDFLYLTAGAVGAVGAAGTGWTLVDSLNPAADATAFPSIEVDLEFIAPGTGATVPWRGKPVFIRHRTSGEIAEAENVDIATLPDPQADRDRTVKPQWLVVFGVCTHLGCIPLGQKPGDPRGAWGGYVCPCHGSQFDISGRVRKGPAARNLSVPHYAFLTDTRLKIG